jgi:histidinol-phosphate aminotransferase
MLRTLSKAFAMAGVRVGYAVADPAVAVELQKAVSAFPLSIFSDITAQVAIENAERFIEGARSTIAERERMAAALKALGVQVLPSGTNFLLVKPPIDGALIVAHLRSQHNMLVTDGSAWPQLRGYVRISVGSAEQNDLVIQGFKELIQ